MGDPTVSSGFLHCRATRSRLSSTPSPSRESCAERLSGDPPRWVYASVIAYAERPPSAAAGSRSEAEAVGSQLQGVVSRLRVERGYLRSPSRALAASNGQRWPTQVPVGLLLIGVGRAHQDGVAEMGPNQLESERQPVGI